MTSRRSKQRRQKRKYEEYMQDDIAASTSSSEAGVKSSRPSNISEPCVHTEDASGGMGDLGESELCNHDFTSSDHSDSEEETVRIPADRQPNENSQILIRD